MSLTTILLALVAGALGIVLLVALLLWRFIVIERGAEAMRRRDPDRLYPAAR